MGSIIKGTQALGRSSSKLQTPQLHSIPKDTMDHTAHTEVRTVARNLLFVLNVATTHVHLSHRGAAAATTVQRLIHVAALDVIFAGWSIPIAAADLITQLACEILVLAICRLCVVTDGPFAETEQDFYAQCSVEARRRREYMMYEISPIGIGWWITERFRH